MVLTNFELWAADGVTNGSNLPLDFVESNQLHHNRHVNPFDPRAVTQLNSNSNHLSSNGYYGFSYINSVHDNNNNNNNNNNNTSNINHNNNNNNNNSTTYNFMANDVNGMNNTQQLQQTHVSSVNFGSSAYAAGHAVPVARCKKRFFVMNDDDDATAAVAANNCTATNKNYHNYEVSAKRCRFDDDFSAQYCNDFFQLPSTQIATQSCLMDTEEGFENNNNNNNDNNNIEKYEQTLNPQLQTLTAHQQQQQQLHHQQINQQQQQQPQQQHLYHQQQHYQGHLHRANRDVSRCMLSHMI
ncbi:hypothetical protein FF38_11034 [Lucilia cuprina]|uniref:Uncharacterized protein n=1 Tax=Lucilia cuprina TaxID=7375 RepID=A0A0L0BQP4_LUCCU|nr:hypothetical protein CVS40_11933 [Lucilia cuprina]KNC21554.1 hypothetical protein FF38_11034 [Lucilia cuprina]